METTYSWAKFTFLYWTDPKKGNFIVQATKFPPHNFSVEEND